MRVRNKGDAPISVPIASGEVLVIPPGVEVELDSPPMEGYVYPGLEEVIHEVLSPVPTEVDQVVNPHSAGGEIPPSEAVVETPLHEMLPRKGIATRAFGPGILFV